MQGNCSIQYSTLQATIKHVGEYEGFLSMCPALTQVVSVTDKLLSSNLHYQIVYLGAAEIK